MCRARPATRVVACVAAMALLAAGCADDGPASTSAPTGTSPTSTAATTDTTAAATPVVRPAWAQPNGGYANHRVADSEIDSTNVDQLGIVWSAPIDAPSGMAGIPVVDEHGTVYVQDFDSNVIAYDLETGEQLWKQTYDLQTIGPNGVAYDHGVVYGVTSLEAFALDAATGVELWKTSEIEVPVGGAEGSTLGFTIQPIVSDGVVYLSEAAKAGGGDVLALDAATGAELWRFDTTDEPEGDETPSGGAWSSPALDEDGNVYFGTGNGYYSHNSPPEHRDERLYTNSALKLDAATGELEWFYQAVPNDFWDWDLHLSPILAEAGGRSVTIVGGKMGRIYSIDRDTGELIWETPVGTHNGHDFDGQAQLDGSLQLPATPFEVFPGTLGGIETNMAYADGMIYAAVVNVPSLIENEAALFNPTPPPDMVNGYGSVVAVDAATGDIAWSRDIEQIPFGSMTVSNDLVFTTTFDGMLRAYSIDDGSEVWAGALPAGSNASPTIVGDMIVVAAGVPLAAGMTAELVAFRLGGHMASMPDATDTTAPDRPATEATPGAIEIGVIDGQNRFDTDELTVEAGTVTFRFTNTEAIGHNFAIRIDGEVTDRTAIIANDVVELTVDLEPGEYEFICEPHLTLGMTGVLIVT